MKKLPAPFTVLSVGCGDGQFLFAPATKYRHSRFIGTDKLAENITFCERYAKSAGLTNLELYQADLNHFEPDVKADLILCFGVLHYVEDDVSALKSLKKACSENGRLFIYSPINGRTETAFFQWADKRFNHYEKRMGRVRVYTEEEILTKLMNSGFKISEKQYTYGKIGRIGYELVQGSLIMVAEGSWPYKILGFILYHLILPLAWISMFLDLIWPKKDGNGMMILAEPRH